VWESVTSQVSQVLQLHDRKSQVMSHDEYGKPVHRLYSSCISSVENLMETPLSSFCQLGLGG